MRILILGGTGLIGRQVSLLLEGQGHQVVAASPSRGVNSVTGEGLEAALRGADVVVDVSNSPTLEDQAAAHFFTRSAANLAAAARKATVKHLVVLSIVGADRVSGSGYFAGKVAQELAYRDSGVPYTILRATQFFELLEVITAFGVGEDGSIRVTRAAFQPVAAADVAAEVARLAEGEPAQGIVEFAGPERRSLAEFVEAFLAKRGDSRRVLVDPTVGYFGVPIEENTLVPSGAAGLGHVTLQTWSDSLVSA